MDDFARVFPGASDDWPELQAYDMLKFEVLTVIPDSKEIHRLTA